MSHLSTRVSTVFLLLVDPHIDLLLASTNCPILSVLCGKNSSQGHFSNLESWFFPLFLYASAHRLFICFICLSVAISTKVISYDSSVPQRITRECNSYLPTHCLTSKTSPYVHGFLGLLSQIMEKQRRDVLKEKSSYSPL